MEEKKREEVTESMLMDPTLSFCKRYILTSFI